VPTVLHGRGFEAGRLHHLDDPITSWDFHQTRLKRGFFLPPGDYLEPSKSPRLDNQSGQKLAYTKFKSLQRPHDA
jgi:hypothetical protein